MWRALGACERQHPLAREPQQRGLLTDLRVELRDDPARPRRLAAQVQRLDGERERRAVHDHGLAPMPARDGLHQQRPRRRAQAVRRGLHRLEDGGLLVLHQPRRPRRVVGAPLSVQPRERVHRVERPRLEHDLGLARGVLRAARGAVRRLGAPFAPRPDRLEQLRVLIPLHDPRRAAGGAARRRGGRLRRPARGAPDRWRARHVRLTARDEQQHAGGDDRGAGQGGAHGRLSSGGGAGGPYAR